MLCQLGHPQNLGNPNDLPVGLSPDSLGSLLQSHSMGNHPPSWVIPKKWGTQMTSQLACPQNLGFLLQSLPIRQCPWLGHPQTVGNPNDLLVVLSPKLGLYVAELPQRGTTWLVDPHNSGSVLQSNGLSRVVPKIWVPPKLYDTPPASHLACR